jgi:hypothetical protein
MAHSKSMFFRDAFDGQRETQMEVFGLSDGVMIKMGEFPGTEEFVILDFDDVKVLITELQSLLPKGEK